MSEENDMSGEHPEVLRSMISEAERWSRSHTQPLWFYTEKAAEQWKHNGMPNPEAIFNFK